LIRFIRCQLNLGLNFKIIIMAKPTKYATPICIVMSILAIIGIATGLIFKSPLFIIFFLLPTVIYEVYRTEGRSTKTSSILLLLVLIGEVILIIFKISFNLAEFLGDSEKYVGGYLVPLGDLRIIAPTIMAVLSVILFMRTRGVYTKWLAVIIFITAFALVYTIDPQAFSDLIKYATEEGLRQV
jgi:hypothetical protein